MKQKISKVKEFISNLMYPNDIKCVFCGEELNQNACNFTCEECFGCLPFITNPCSKCGSPMNDNQQGVCLKCKSRNFSFVQAKSVFEYTSQPLMLVHKLKYSKKKYLVEAMSKYLIDIYATWNLFADIITNVPMFPTKEKERGFNQSSLLAKQLSESVKVPFVELCAKIVDTPSQTDLTINKRIENVKNTFSFRNEHKKLITGKTILIIDDVVTTGATTSELSRIMLEAGAKECYVLSFAHTDIEQISFEN